MLTHIQNYSNCIEKDYFMDQQIKIKMEDLKKLGFGYKRISKQLNLNVNTVASYFKRKDIQFRPVYCKNCGYKIIQMNKTGRKKKFCSEKCRLSYYKYLKNRYVIL